MIGLVAAYFPFSTIENPYFHLAFQMLPRDIKIPSAITLTRLLAKEYTMVLTWIRDILSGDSKVLLAMDGWTLVNKWAIISIIASWINQYLELQMLQLSFEECRGSHDGNALGAHLLDVLHRFNLDTGWLLGVTTNNTSSNYKMAKTLEEDLTKAGRRWDSKAYHVPCMAHVIQLCLGAFMNTLEVQQHEKHWMEVEQEKNQTEGEQQVKGLKMKKRLVAFEKIPSGFAKIVECVGPTVLFACSFS
jgi:hypothetical protein